MGEQWARDAIRKGVYQHEGVDYKIEKSSTGLCTGCLFYEGLAKRTCGGKFVTICTTGGNIFKK